MAKKRRDDDLDALSRVFQSLDEAPPGLHDVEPPATELPEGLPPGLIELYAHCDGARLFVDAIEIVSSTAVTTPVPGRWKFAEIDGAAIAIDQRGKIWRDDEALDDAVCEGTRLDRWLSGTIESTALFYDADGEFAEDAFDEEGEINPELRERSLRAQLKRDPTAPGPRWRLALALLDQDTLEKARDELEQVVSDDPSFAWAWLDLARISERLGDLGNALDEARMAADTAEGSQHPQAGYFHAQLARLASRSGDEATRAQAAAKATRLAPELKQAQIAGARESLTQGDVASARGLLDILRAVWPRDLDVLDLATKVDAATN
jgi:tetratricopeptide (TPR) repeat protein